jgi:hypothetical protein
MRKQNRKSTASSSKRPRALAITGLGMVLATALIVAGVARTNVSASAGVTMGTDQGTQDAPGQQKKYKTTRPIVKDQQTGELRLPTTEELQQTIDSLSSLTRRDVAAAQPTATAVTGWSALGVSATSGVFVVRPNEDGTMETRCVFTFEEAAAFLGLVEDIQ